MARDPDHRSVASLPLGLLPAIPGRSDPDSTAAGLPDRETGRFGVLVRRLSTLAALSAAEMNVVRGLVADVRRHPPHSHLHLAGTLSPARLVVAGWACRSRALPDGNRQVLGFALPGDLTEPVRHLGLPLSCAVVALTELETVSAQPLADVAAAIDPAHPGLARATRLMAYLDDMLLCDQVVRLGRQSAPGRFAHLMLELHDRLACVGLASDDGFAMPLTHGMLADALGLGVVQVNRIVQQLRRDGLLEIRDGVVTLSDFGRLQALAGWKAPHRFSVQ